MGQQDSLVKCLSLSLMTQAKHQEHTWHKNDYLQLLIFLNFLFISVCVKLSRNWVLGWRDASAVKSSGFNSQHPYQAAYNHQFQGDMTLPR